MERLNSETEQPEQPEAPERQATEYVSVREELARTLDRIGELENKASSLDEWTEKCHDLENRLEDTVIEMARQFQDWQERFTTEQEARNEAEALAAQHSAEAERLKKVNQELQQKLDSLPEYVTTEVWKLVQPLHAQLDKFRPSENMVGQSSIPGD